MPAYSISPTWWLWPSMSPGTTQSPAIGTGRRRTARVARLEDGLDTVAGDEQPAIVEPVARRDVEQVRGDERSGGGRRSSPERSSAATMRTMTTTDRLPFTGDDEADRYLASEPLALLIGFELDQQVTVQKAFSGPNEIRSRLGHLDAKKIAGDAARGPRRRVPDATGDPSLPGRDGRAGAGPVPRDRRRLRQRRQPGVDRGDQRQGPRGAPARLARASGL